MIRVLFLILAKGFAGSTRLLDGKAKMAHRDHQVYQLCVARCVGYGLLQGGVMLGHVAELGVLT